ncbi:MAG: sigma-70 family RNA polymerase sigma factor [Deltaproteobacteria bacterium]
MGKSDRTDPAGWLDAHGDALFRFALIRVRDRALAEDLVQETLLAAFRGREGFSGRSSERTWLVGILKNKIADHYRRAARENSRDELLLREALGGSPFDGTGRWKSGPSEWGTDPAALARQAGFLEQLRRCLSELPGAQADAFTLREVDGLGTREICKVLEITETNLWVILHRARMRLRACLEANWFGRKGTERG